MSGFCQGRGRPPARSAEGWIRSESALRRLPASWATDLSRSTRKLSAQEVVSSGEGSSSWIRSKVSIPSEVEVEAWRGEGGNGGGALSSEGVAGLPRAVSSRAPLPDETPSGPKSLFSAAASTLVAPAYSLDSDVNLFIFLRFKVISPIYFPPSPLY